MVTSEEADKVVPPQFDAPNQRDIRNRRRMCQRAGLVGAPAASWANPVKHAHWRNSRCNSAVALRFRACDG